MGGLSSIHPASASLPPIRPHGQNVIDRPCDGYTNASAGKARYHTSDATTTKHNPKKTKRGIADTRDKAFQNRFQNTSTRVSEQSP